MSYNVDTWKTKELDNLVIPVASFFKHERSDWHPEIIRTEKKSIFTITDTGYLSGSIEVVDGCEYLHVAQITFYGEGSGTALSWIIEPALRDSRGKLVASRVWEGGDLIDRLTVVDGVVSSEEIQI